MAALPSHKEKKTAEMQLGLSYSRSPPWILHEGETHVKTPPKLSFSQHLDPSSCGCETSEFVLLSIWDLWKARRLQIALAVSTKVCSVTGHTRKSTHLAQGKEMENTNEREAKVMGDENSLPLTEWMQTKNHPKISLGHFFLFFFLSA